MRLTLVPTCPNCGSTDMVATAWVAWLPKCTRYTVRTVVDGLWACYGCKDAGRDWIDLEPVWDDPPSE